MKSISTFALLALMSSIAYPADGQRYYTSYNALVEADTVLVDDGFGQSVDIHGPYAVVGAFLDNNSHGEKAGAMYVFEDTPSGWVQKAKVVGIENVAEDRLGLSVRMFGDRIVGYTGRPPANSGPNEFVGAFVFRRDGENWVQETRLYPDDLQQGEVLGNKPECLDMDDNYVVVGGDNALQELQVYIFKRTETSWAPLGRLNFDTSGYGCHISGNHLFIGSPFDDEAATDAGAVFVYERTGDNFAFVQKVVADDAQADDRFGYGLAGSGTTAAFGNNPHNRLEGAVYIFENSGGSWAQTDKLQPSDAPPKLFRGLWITMNNEWLAASDFSQDDSGENSGAAYLWKKDQSGWVENAKLLPAEIGNGDGFGVSLAMDDTHLILGADSHLIGDGFGEAYIYNVQEVIATNISNPVRGAVVAGAYPVPARNSVTIGLAASVAGPWVIEIVDVTGRLVKREAVAQPGEHSIDVQDLPSGMYFATVLSGAGKYIDTFTLAVVR